MDFLKIIVSVLLIALFVFIFGHKSFNRLLEDGVTTSNYEEIPHKIQAPGYLKE